MKKSTTISDYSGHDIYIGIDVHKNSWSATCSTANVVKRPVRITRPFVANLVDYVTSHYPNGTYHFAYEAGFSGFWTKRALDQYGYDTIVVHPADIPVSNKDRNFKNDSRDSNKLSCCLRSGEIEGIYCPPLDAEKDRSILRVRNQIAKQERQTKNRIKSMLFEFGYEVPEDLDGSHWSKRLLEWIRHIAEIKQMESIDFQLNMLLAIRVEHARILRRLRQMARSTPHREICDILKSMSGIGLLSSIKLRLEIVEMNRFRTTDQLLAYMGLIPTTRSSGDKSRIGKMTRRGRTELKRTMIECAWVAKRVDPHLSAQYEIWARKTTPNKAIVKLAVKMVRMLRHMWLNGVLYEPQQVIIEK